MNRKSLLVANSGFVNAVAATTNQHEMAHSGGLVTTLTSRHTHTALRDQCAFQHLKTSGPTPHHLKKSVSDQLLNGVCVSVCLCTRACILFFK